MEPADWFYVGLSILLQAVGLSILTYAAGARWLGWPERWRFWQFGLIGGLACALLGLHLLGLLWQLPHRPLTRPLPVFVCLCTNVLVAALLIVGLLAWILL